MIIPFYKIKAKQRRNSKTRFKNTREKIKKNGLRGNNAVVNQDASGNEAMLEVESDSWWKFYLKAGLAIIGLAALIYVPAVYVLTKPESKHTELFDEIHLDIQKLKASGDRNLTYFNLYMSRAHDYLANNQLKEACIPYRAALIKLPSDSTANVEFAKVLIERSHMEEDISYEANLQLEKVLALHPSLATDEPFKTYIAN